MLPLFVFILTIINVFNNGVCDNPGDPCLRNSTDDSGPKPGICKHIRQCIEVMDGIFNNIPPPPPCFIPKESSSIESFVCCLDKADAVRTTTEPPPTTTTQTTPSTPALPLTRRKCSEYSKYVFEEVLSPVLFPGSSNTTLADRCVKSAEGLIVGGKEALEGEFPHMALLGYGKSKDDLDFQCAGSLISEDYVLTAAHCTTGNRPTFVLLGAHTRTLGDEEDEYSEQLIPIYPDRGVIPHPDYKPLINYHDIALIRLLRKPKLNSKVRPACLHDGDPYSQGSLIVSGWGHTEHAGSSSEALMKVNLNESTLQSCQKAHKVNARLPDGIRDSQQICAGFAEGGKDSCQGDSGGPIQVFRNKPHCMYDVVGVVSFGKGCGLRNTPGVYTRVSYYIDWVTTIIWPGFA